MSSLQVSGSDRIAMGYQRRPLQQDRTISKFGLNSLRKQTKLNSIFRHWDISL